jgi:hypothetical protein
MECILGEGVMKCWGLLRTPNCRTHASSPNSFSESAHLCFRTYMFSASSHTNGLSTSPRITAIPATHRLADSGSRLNGEPYSGHVVHRMLILNHPATPDEHTKHLDQVLPSHTLCHIGFVGKKEVYSSNHNSPR